MTSPVTAAASNRPVLTLVKEGRSATAPYDELVEQAQEAETQGRRAEARALYESALASLSESGRGARASDILRWIARTHRADGDRTLALDCADAALAVAEAHHDEAALGNAINLQAIIHWDLGLVNDAERLFHLARESALRAGEAKLSAMTAQNLGVIANIRGDLEQALQFYQSSLATYRALGMATDVCIALNNQGLLFTQRQDWAAAAVAYDEAMHVAEALGDQKSCVKIEVNRAECLVAQARYADARQACDRASTRAVSLSDEKDGEILGALQKVFGIIEREAGQYSRAEEYLTRARAYATERSDLLLLAEATKECAELHRRQGRNRDTLQCLNQSHRLFWQLRARRELADIDRRLTQLEHGFLDVVRQWGESIESKDDYTQGHCERVAAMACALAERTGMDEQSLFWFRIGALLHDVGKLMVPAEVLNKAGALSPEEWALVRQHPSAGVEMLADVDFPWDVRPIVESHHERWDGKGYPHGLQGEAIPYVARILCIADVYDALTSERSYKKAMTHADAIDAMRLDVGTIFDPALFALFEEVAPRFSTPNLAPVSIPRLVPSPVPAPVAPQVDELTELPLRRAFAAATTAALAARAPNEPVSLLVIDVDHFKLINDTYGHLRGDDVLRLVADTLRGQVRPSDFLARYAGDEFVLLLPGTSQSEAVALAERLRTTMYAIPIAAGNSGPVALTISVGVGTVTTPGVTSDGLFASADAALLLAKRQGRDAVACADGTPAPTRPAPRLERFVGRRAEQPALVTLLDQATRGRPRVVAIVGEAGVGKSALVRELGPEIRLRAASQVAARCVDTETRPPFQPWTSVLDAIRVLRVVPERRWRALGQLVPALGGDAAPLADRNCFALFAEVRDYLRLASLARPLVVLLEDMQWADAASWDLLEYLVGHLERERVLVCMTMRAEDIRGDVLERRGRLSRDDRFHEIALGRLTDAEVRDWVNAALEQEAGNELLSYLHRTTEGNPFFLVQFLRSMLDSGDLAWNEERWVWQPRRVRQLPTAVRDLLMRRVARLSPRALQTITAAAVMGRSVDIDRAVAAEIATEDALLDAIEEGMAASVLVADPLGRDDQMVFRHGLFIDVLHQDVHPRRLGRIRERVARSVGTEALGAELRGTHTVARGLRGARLHGRQEQLKDRDAAPVSWK